MNQEPVVNAGEVLGALREVGAALGMAVRPYSVTAGASFASFVAAMAGTGVLVARHGPLLANAAFLPPGALVLELLPYNWEWRGLSEVYRNLTRSVGSLHHFAWKANSSEVGCGLWVVVVVGGGGPADRLPHRRGDIRLEPGEARPFLLTCTAPVLCLPLYRPSRPPAVGDVPGGRGCQVLALDRGGVRLDVRAQRVLSAHCPEQPPLLSVGGVSMCAR